MKSIQKWKKNVLITIIFRTILVIALWSCETCCFINPREEWPKKPWISFSNACFSPLDYEPHALVILPPLIQNVFTQCLWILGTAHGTKLTKHVVMGRDVSKW